MWQARINKIVKIGEENGEAQYQAYDISDHTEFRIDEPKLPVQLKTGDHIEGYLAGGAIVATKILGTPWRAKE